MTSFFSKQISLLTITNIFASIENFEPQISMKQNVTQARFATKIESQNIGFKCPKKTYGIVELTSIVKCSLLFIPTLHGEGAQARNRQWTSVGSTAHMFAVAKTIAHCPQLLIMMSHKIIGLVRVFLQHNWIQLVGRSFHVFVCCRNVVPFVCRVKIKS